MDFDISFIQSPYSTLLVVSSLLGFIYVARKRAAVWIHGRAGKIRAATGAAARPSSRDQRTLLIGLVLLGIGLSDIVFILYHKAEMFETESLHFYLGIYFLFALLPGAFAGMIASLWIDPTGMAREGSLLGRVFYGILFFLALLTIIAFTDYDLLLFAFGPAVMLLIYALSPATS